MISLAFSKEQMTPWNFFIFYSLSYFLLICLHQMQFSHSPKVSLIIFQKDKCHVCTACKFPYLSWFFLLFSKKQTSQCNGDVLFPYGFSRFFQRGKYSVCTLCKYIYVSRFMFMEKLLFWPVIYFNYGWVWDKLMHFN